MRFLAVAIFVALLSSSANGQVIGTARHTVTQLKAGSMFHASITRGRENVAYVGRGPGQRLRASAMWLRSPGHRPAMFRPGITVCRGGYCTRRTFR